MNKRLAARVALDELAEVFAEAVVKATNVGDRARMRRAKLAIESAILNVSETVLVYSDAETIIKGVTDASV